MPLNDQLAPLSPDISRRPGEARYRWDGILAVIVLDDGTVGQFATSGAWSREEVVDAVHRCIQRGSAGL